MNLPTTSHQPISAQTGRVLICEDDERQARLLKMELLRLGYDVVDTSQTGEEAVRLAAALRPDIVLMDIMLPRLSGIEATRQIMAQAPCAIVMITALGDDTMVREALDAGASAYLVKSARGDQLRPTLIVAQSRFREMADVQKELMGLEATLEGRKLIEKAKGMIARQINAEEIAFHMLRKFSNDRGISLYEAALLILQGKYDFSNSTEGI